MSQTKILWGPTTWTFFHVLAVKVNENFFINNKNDIINIIKTICKNLPCPLCSEHAKLVIGYNNTRLINSKVDLINFLHFFHNNVNSRTGKDIFKKEDLEKYKKMNIGIALQNFITFYTKSYNKNTFKLNIKSSQDSRKQIAKSVIKWFKKNWIYFN